MTAPRDRRAVAAGYDAGADGYDARHADRRGAARARAIDRVLLDATRGAARVLEIGVGTGRLLAQVAAPTRVGVDVAGRMLAHARARGLAVVQADGHALPIASGSVDAVIAGKGALRYLDPAVALPEIARVLRPGGALAAHLYPRRTLSLRSSPAPAPELWQPADTAALVATLAGAGFAVERIVRLRAVRWWPYALAIPAWIDARSPLPLWSHVAVVARRP
ncbi:MAG: class I SAM-dependent methyltransferase [Myxococcales bacterium]|nr:class I SAM-dependent methyltransferase [Myxococcales bacterium]